MKRFLFAAAIAAATAPAFAAADVGVSINVGQPGFYGQINIGDYPPPQLIYRQPIIIQRAPVRVVQQPIYLHVPPGQARHWGKHCRRYNACGRQVYFVQDNWYNDVYVPRHRERHDDRGEHHGRGRDHGDHNDDRGERHGGRGHDNGHGKKHRNED
jgi:hypothetical protein